MQKIGAVSVVCLVVCAATAAVGGSVDDCRGKKDEFVALVAANAPEGTAAHRAKALVNDPGMRWHFAVMQYNTYAFFFFTGQQENLSEQQLKEFLVADQLVDCWRPEAEETPSIGSEHFAQFDDTYTVDRRELLRTLAEELL